MILDADKIVNDAFQLLQKQGLITYCEIKKGSKDYEWLLYNLPVMAGGTYFHLYESDFNTDPEVYEKVNERINQNRLLGPDFESKCGANRVKDIEKKIFLRVAYQLLQVCDVFVWDRLHTYEKNGLKVTDYLRKFMYDGEEYIITGVFPYYESRRTYTVVGENTRTKKSYKFKPEDVRAGLI